MSLPHVIYIPGVILIGLAIGYAMGARAAREEMARRKAKLKE